MTIANAKPDQLIRGPLGTTTVNAASSAWWDVSTVEAKISEAIAYAVSIGAKAVYVPDCFLPYTASLVTFNPAVKMTREGGNPAWWDILAYGAQAGGADCTVAIQAAVNGASAGVNPGTVYCPAGDYLISATITVTNGITFFGSGMHTATQQTTFLANTTTLDPVFSITSDNGVNFHDFLISAKTYPSTPQTAGAMIRVRGSTLGVTFNQHSRFTNLRFDGPWIGIDFVDATVWSMTGCYFEAAQFAGAQIDNPINPDVGDNTILGNWFWGSSVAGAVGILHKGGGALRVTNNKFQPYSGAGGAGYKFAWASATVSSSQLLIEYNNFDQVSSAQPGTAINFASAASVFVGVSIIGNIIKYNTDGGIVSQAAAAKISQVLIASNIFSATASTTAITINQLLQHVAVDANHFYTSAGNPTAINIGNSVTNFSVYIGSNKYQTGYQPWVINGGVIVTGPGNGGAQSGPADQATIAIDLSFGNVVLIAPTTSRTVGTPTNGLVGSTVMVEVLNSSAGVITTTWNGSWKLSGAWVDPATTKRRMISFYVVDGAGNMREISRTAADQ